MSGYAIICEFDTCLRHGGALHGYPCHDCQTEWQQAHPERRQAIADYAAGKISGDRLHAILRTAP